MSIFAKLFKKKTTEEESARVGGMEDFMTLIRVYYQAVMAAQLGISNINALPDMAVFKRTLKIPTQNNKLGVAERSRCKKMLTDIYGINRDRRFYQKTLQERERYPKLLVHVPRLQPRPDDGSGQPDAMEIPYAGYLQESLTRHD